MECKIRNLEMNYEVYGEGKPIIKDIYFKVEFIFKYLFIIICLLG
jgi:hypothetical protein